MPSPFLRSDSDMQKITAFSISSVKGRVRSFVGTENGRIRFVVLDTFGTCSSKMRTDFLYAAAFYKDIIVFEA